MMDKKLNREILRLSLPSILANISVPLVGFVDTAISGHLYGVSAAAAIGAVSVGSMFLSLLYWNFAFLRAGTGGLTAQAYGAGDDRTAAKMLWRGLGVALAVAAVLLILQWPFLKLATLVTHASQEVTALAQKYFLIRIWAAPATLSLLVFSGWFVGEQDSMSSMWKDLIVNGVNIVASIVLSKFIGFNGIALGTVIAQYCGLLFCIVVAALKYRRLLSSFPLKELKHAFTRDELLPASRAQRRLQARRAGSLPEDERQPLRPLAVLYGHISRLHPYRCKAGRPAASLLFGDDAAADALLLFYGWFCLRRRGADRTIHRSGRQAYGA